MSFFKEPISAVVNRLQQGRGLCSENVATALKQIDGRDADLHAFLYVQRQAALEQASRLDALPLEQRKKYPLFGIPVAVKDNICTTTLPTSCGSRILENFVSPYNATVVEFLQQAGAIIIGKTNMDEFAMGSSTESSAYGITRNPHNREYIPGGSSGGSAAAVAAGFVAAAVGSDTGGSIRQPASHCGVFGLKPTYGRISRYGLVAFASSLDQIGPFASDIRDIGLLLEVLSGSDSRDSTYGGRQFINNDAYYTQNLTGMRVGILKEYFGPGLSDEVRTVVQRCIDALQVSGAKLVEVSLPHVSYGIATYYILCTAEASSNLARFDGVKYGLRAQDARTPTQMYAATRQQGFGPEVKRRIMLGTYVLSAGYYDAYYVKAQKVRSLIRSDFETAFQHCDAIVSPVGTTPAFKLGEKCDDPLQMYLTDIYTVTANLAEIPSISVPAGTNPAGLPIGIQFMAPHWREETLLRLGYVVQRMGN
ncbi:MAG: Asp-tRNA(Asn)/Glu-tRNA(Gln) amidotransferase subunit GatA [Chitinivibrionales bacterium]|nr:Asp-tRNA(Asn)/Glu-tRNA(Gln) amidotransferase subunit GatA [Chitinivibrionales bacterium]